MNGPRSGRHFQTPKELRMIGGDQNGGGDKETPAEQVANIAEEIRNEGITPERAEEIAEQLQDIATEISGTTEHEGGNA